MSIDELDTYTRLRAWATGVHTVEAATELLIRTGWARDGLPWVAVADDQIGRWIDVDQITPETIGGYSGGEQRLLRIAAALLDDHHPVDLGSAVAGIDHTSLDLVLAAIAHAGGSHQHVRLKYDEDTQPVGYEQLAPLYDWPGEDRPKAPEVE